MNDAQLFLEQIQEENCWLRFKLDKNHRVTCVAWAYESQRRHALRHHSVIIQDTVFNTKV